MKNRIHNLMRAGLFLFLLLPNLRADTALVFNEIMYHPQSNVVTMEWVELYNQMAVDLDVSNWRIANGFYYVFPQGTIVRGGGYVVVAFSPADVAAETGLTNVLGPSSNPLSDSGATLELRNNDGRLVDSVTFGVDGEWPVGPNGGGVSLSKLDPDSTGALPENWSASAQMGGTPGARNFPRFGVTGTSSQPLMVDSAWKYQAAGVDPGVGWNGTNFDDSAWASGAALFTAGTNLVGFGVTRAIPTLWNSGVGPDGAVLAPGSADPHYILLKAPTGVSPPPPVAAMVVLNHPSWLGNSLVSSWLGPVNPGSANAPAGGYNYQTTFDLSAFDLSSVNLSFNMAADDMVTNVLLNGVLTGSSYTGFNNLSPNFTFNSGFVPGTNTLEFRAVNAGTSPNPGGFRVEARGTGFSVLTNTVLAAGPITYYFRAGFNFTDDPTQTTVTLHPVVSDGAVFYLNGTEIYRLNMPAGPVSASTYALSSVGPAAYSGPFVLPGSSLARGTNVLAVEVHRAANTTDNMVFGSEFGTTTTFAGPTPLAFNEVASGLDPAFWVELINFGTNELALGNYAVAVQGSTNATYVLPGDASLAGGSRLALDQTQLAFRAQPGDRLFLYSAVRDKVMDAVVVTNRLRGRFPEGTGPWLYPLAATPGNSNSFQLHNEVVINEIMYDHFPAQTSTGFTASAEQWIELYNRGTNPVDLTGWALDGGISYSFPAGRTLDAGGFLVVAKQSATLQAIYPSAPIIGDFAHSLAHGDELVVLRDSSGNPANQVHYFSGGRWPQFTGAGGSSLELRDPMADNSRPEAWAASDEGSKASWSNYTYRAVATNDFQPTQWNEFVLGLLADGECLVDDISVLESPTNASPVQLIANGNFESGATGWRILGNHNRSRVEVDPDQPGNHVLHVEATGPTEHMHNHIETTYVGGRAIAAGKLYQVSFRAKWLTGVSLLNTRLYFNRVHRTTVLGVPALNGTPGAPNSRYAGNIGPTFSQFQHQPVVPAVNQPVTVSVVTQDPQGVSACTLWWAVDGVSWNSSAMVAQGNGLYTGTVPGLSAGTLVQFYVQASDGLGATSMYPAAGPNSRALYRVNDGQAILNLAHNVRILMTPADTAMLHALTNVMSNDNLGTTVVYDEGRAYYNMGVRLKSSERGRDQASRVSFHLEFNPDDLFRGVHPVMLLDRSGGWMFGNTFGQEEILIKHMMNRAGNIPQVYNEICRVIAPQSAQTGSAIFFPRFEDEFLGSQYPTGANGTLFEYELTYYPTSTSDGTPTGYKLPEPDQVVGTDIMDLGGDKETYRYNFIIKNKRQYDDYSHLMDLCRTFSLTGTALDAASRNGMDVDQWMRAFAMESLCGVGDIYNAPSAANFHNVMIYGRSSDNLAVTFPWDMDFAFTRAPSDGLVGSANLGKIINLPGNLRIYYAHLLDLIGSSFNSAYMGYWVNHYTKFCPGQDFTKAGTSGWTILSYLDQRGAFVRSQLASVSTNRFSINGTNSYSTSNNLVVLSGSAPVQVRTILINGIAYPVTWTTTSGWSARLALAPGTNVFSIQGYDMGGNALTNAALSLSINYVGPAPQPQGALVINEIMYNPLVPEASYLEIFNTASNLSFDVTGWRLDGVGFTFPPMVITNRQFIVLAQDAGGFANAYGSGVVPAAVFPGQLSLIGETLSLVKPGATADQDLVVNRVRYEPAAPWPQGANGGGAALQVIDPLQDNSRVGNWSDGATWRFVSLTGLAGASRLQLLLDAAGDMYLDDLWLTDGTTPAVGTNYILDGDFEGPLTTNVGGPWVFSSTNLANTTTSTAVKHSGSSSLHLVFNTAGSATTLLFQDLAGVITNNTYTLSFWYLPGSNASNLTCRLGNTLRTTLRIRLPSFTPGTTNSVASSLPPFPPLWINEVQPDNLSAITDSAAEHDPWLEIYNAGAATVSLDGIFLANNYTNLAQWGFPTGQVINAGEFKIVFADGEPGQTTPAEPHASFRLTSTTGSIVLSRSYLGTPQIMDYINYSGVHPDDSFGSFPDGQPFYRHEFYHSTPGRTNDGMAPPVVVYINEWMASNTRTLPDLSGGSPKYDDWIELFNPGPDLVDLSGYYLTDTLANKFQFHIPDGYTVPGGGYLLVWADGEPAQNTPSSPDLHVTFQLSKSGEAIGLFAPDGTQIDAVTFGQQTNDVSMGRYPDGGPVIYYMGNPTPRTANTSPFNNTVPVLGSISNRAVVLGQTVSFAISATDTDQPPQTLTFSLDPGAPNGASVTAGGQFNWTPLPSQAPSTNSLTIRVTDSGVPPLSVTRSFIIRVTTPPRTAVTSPANGIVSLSFATVPGHHYRVQYKDTLGAAVWTQLGSDVLATDTSLSVPDDLGNQRQRFYRIVVLD